jgi:hypothetical protein
MGRCSISGSVWGILVGAGLVVSLPNDAAALGEQRSLSGQWVATALSEVWKFGAWPVACGPKPSSDASPAGTSLVNEESGELSFSGPGRAFRTNQCWEQYPGLRRVAHSRSAEAWSSTCKSAEGDPRQANVHTSLTAFGGTLLKFRETGSYEFHIGGAKCSAQVTRSRTFSRSAHEVNEADSLAIGAEGPSVPETAAPLGDPGAVGELGAEVVGPKTGAAEAVSAGAVSADSKPPAPHGADRPLRSDCEPSGAAREIRMPRPVNWLQPGASYRLTPAIVDATGCLVAKGPFTYVVEPETDAVHVGLRSGLIQVAPQAPEGKYTVIIRSGQLREVIEVPVITREGLAAFLEAPTAAPLGTVSVGASVPEIVGTSPAAASDSATPRKWWFTGLAGLVILGLGGLGLRLLRAGSRPTMPPPPPPSVTTASAAGVSGGGASSAPAASRSAVASGQLALTVVPPAVVQPQTRSNPPPKPRSVVETTSGEGRACPQCGTRYTDGSVFCGVDGAKLPDPAERLLEKRS